MDDCLKGLLDNFDQTIRVIRTGYLLANEKPQAKQSTRFARGHSYTPPKKVAYMKRLVSEFKLCYSGQPLRGMLRVTVIYCFPWTQQQKKMASLGWALTDRGIDIDNLFKPTFDSLQGLVMVNDSQVVEVRARKIRYPRGCIAIRVDEILPNRESVADIC